MSWLLNLVPWWGRALAVLAVLAAAVGFGAVKMHAHDQVAYEALALQFANFKADVAAKGYAAARAAEAQNQRQQEAQDALRNQLDSADARLRAALERLRQRPPGRPDGSTVPVRSCPAEGAGRPADRESVPLADYRALEARAAYDAQSLTLLKEWVARMVAAGALRVE